VRPPARLLAATGGLLRRGLGLPEPRHWATVSRRAVETSFREGAEVGLVTGPQTRLVETILRAGTRPAAEAALSLAESGAAPQDSTVRDLLALAPEKELSRVPLYGGDEANVTGTVHVVRAWGMPPETPLREIARPPVRLDAGASIMQALGELRRARENVGVLWDASAGRATGVVSVEGLLRELIGRGEGGRPAGGRH
jgi:CBS domain containing-hemolysin-like protein